MRTHGESSAITRIVPNGLRVALRGYPRSRAGDIGPCVRERGATGIQVGDGKSRAQLFAYIAKLPKTTRHTPIDRARIPVSVFRVVVTQFRSKESEPPITGSLARAQSAEPVRAGLVAHRPLSFPGAHGRATPLFNLPFPRAGCRPAVARSRRHGRRDHRARLLA